MTSKHIINLFKGVGVIIDNSFGKQVADGDRIWKIKSYLENKHIPILTYKNLPTSNIPHFNNVSFIILDWNLNDIKPIPQAAIEDNIDFLNRVSRCRFIPTFIFTNENIEDVEDALCSAGLYIKDTETNNIFIKSKGELNNSRGLFAAIVKWVKKCPSIYVLKEWENAINNAKVDLFRDLYQINPSWPYIMYKNYQTDLGIDNAEICDLINRNLTNRCAPLVFDKAILSKKKSGVSKEDLRKLLEYERFVKSNALQDYPAMGDVIKTKGCYYINIRPDCDIVRDPNPELYCLKGEVVKDEKINNNKRYKFDKVQHCFHEQHDHTIIAFIDEGKIVDIKFKNLKMMEWDEFKDKRVGRLLPPYITKVKLKYMAYLQRQGIPSTPIEAIK